MQHELNLITVEQSVLQGHVWFQYGPELVLCVSDAWHGQHIGRLGHTNPGFLFQPFTGNLTNWNCRFLELFAKILELFWQNFAKNGPKWPKTAKKLPKPWVISQKSLSYFQNLELFSLKNPWVILEMLKKSLYYCNCFFLIQIKYIIADLTFEIAVCLGSNCPRLRL